MKPSSPIILSRQRLGQKPARMQSSRLMQQGENNSLDSSSQPGRWIFRLSKSIKQEEFKLFLKLLSNRFHSKSFAILIDKLSVYKINLSKECFQELQITPIFNNKYFPQFNGIESYFSILKNEYKNLLLQQIIKGEKIDAVRFIKMAIEAIDEYKTKKCIKYGLDCIKQQQENLRK